MTPHSHLSIKPKLDLWGSIASITCAIHCSVLPIVLSLGLMSGWSWLANEWIDLLLIIISAILVYWSLGSGYRDVHHHKGPLSLALLGFLLFGLGHFGFHEYEMFFSTLGGILIAGSHFFNWRLNKQHLLSCKIAK